MRFLGILLLVIGISLVGYSTTLEAYTNQNEYEEKYYALDGEHKSESFYELRDIYLTKKYALEDYGLTSFVLGAFIIFFFFKGWNAFKIPKNKLSIGLIGLCAVLITTFGYLGDLFLEMNRGSFPHWADSLGIPMASTFVVFIILIIWYALNLIGIFKAFKTGGLVKNLSLDSINYWYAIILMLTIILTGVLILEGNFWQTAAGIIWSYFFLSLLVGRRNGILEKITINPAS